MSYSHLTVYISLIFRTDCFLTAKHKMAVLFHPVKRKQALLGSNLRGITGAEKSRINGTRSSGRVPVSHFGPCLIKPKSQNSLIRCNIALIPSTDPLNSENKCVPEFSYSESLARYESTNDRD